MTRRFRASVVAVVAVVATALTFAASASDTCGGTVTAAGGFYVEYRNEGGIWIYQESNLVSGLQRGGKAMVGGSVDTCTEHPGPYTPDKLIF